MRRVESCNGGPAGGRAAQVTAVLGALVILDLLIVPADVLIALWLAWRVVRLARSARHIPYTASSVRELLESEE